MARRLIGITTGFAVSVLALATAAEARAFLQAEPASSTDNDAAETTVVVTGKTPAVVHKADRTVYDLKDNLQATTGTVADTLNTLPSVAVTTDGNVTVRGQGSVQILVDGKPVTALKGANRANTLQSMPANSISKIEVVTNPGAQFRSDSATVINIITKQSSRRGGTGDAIVNIGQEGRYNASVNGTYGFGRLSLNGGLSLREDGRQTTSHTDRTHYGTDGAPLSLMQEDYRLVSHLRIGTLDAGLSYVLSDTDSLALNSQLSVRRFGRQINDRIRVYDAEATLLSDTLTTSAGPEDQDNRSLNLIYKHKGRRDGETLNFSLRHEEVDPYSDRAYLAQDYNSLVETGTYRIVRNGRQLTDALSGDYVLPLSGDRQWTAGLDIENSLNQSGYVAEVADLSDVTSFTSDSSRFFIGQALSAGYFTYQAPLGKWMVQGGLRVENMLTRLRQGRLDPITETSDVQWNPSLYLSRDLTDANGVKLSYSRRIERPTPYDLNPLFNITGGQDIFIGNPYLKPSQIQSYEAGYSHSARPFSYEATLYYRRSENTITDYVYFLSDTTLVTRRENAGQSRAGGLDLSLDANPTPTISYSLSADIYYNELDAFLAGVETHHSGTSVNGKASLTWKPDKGEDFQLTVQTYGRTLSAQGTQSGFTLTNLSYSRELSARLKVTATGYNIFNTGRYLNTSQTTQVRDDTRAVFRGHIFYVGLAYKLGAVKSGD
jgi:outer membrane receptor protein involved in Fe transport